MGFTDFIQASPYLLAGDSTSKETYQIINEYSLVFSNRYIKGFDDDQTLKNAELFGISN